MPALEKAKEAAGSIKQKEIGEIKTNKNPVDTVKIILDTVNVLF